VLFCENEGPREAFRIKVRNKRKASGRKVAGALYIATGGWGHFMLRYADSAPELRAFIKDKGIDLVILDPLNTFGVEGVGSPWDTEQFRRLLVAAGLGIAAFLGLHHLHATEERLSGAWQGHADTILKMTARKDDPDHVELLLQKLRWAGERQGERMVLARDWKTASFHVVETRARRTKEQRALEAFENTCSRVFVLLTEETLGYPPTRFNAD
jgi:hypothetical protein